MVSIAVIALWTTLDGQVGTASAQTRIVSEDRVVAARAQELVERSLLPTPPVEVELIVAYDPSRVCGIHWALACAKGDRIVVARPRAGRLLGSADFFHELGHVADGHLGDSAFQALAGHLAFEPDTWHLRNITAETFAEAWARCSTRRRYPAHWVSGAPYFDGYEFYPTRSQLRAACHGFAAATRAAGWLAASNPDAW